MPQNDCSVVALHTITGRPYKEVQRILLKHGFDPDKGMQPAPISLAAEELGFTWSVKGSKAAAGMSVDELANAGWPGVWLVFCKGHVMPMVNGSITNFCGYHEEPVQFVMELTTMKKKSFAEAYKDIYGFPDAPEPDDDDSKDDDLPIQHFSLNRLMDTMAKMRVGALRVFRPFEDEVRWGETDGAIRARLTPNQGISIERMTTDLSGKPLWITKKLVKMKTNEFAGQEDAVSSEIETIIQRLAREPIDAAMGDYKNLWSLTKRVADEVRHISAKFVYQEIKKVNDTNFNILFSVSGAGRGKLATRFDASSTPAGIIDMSYDKERGIIKGILTTIAAEDESGSWEIDVPYFMGEFSPTQPANEIVQAVRAGLKFI